MRDFNERILRERERLQGVAAELEDRMNEAKADKIRMEATARETIDRLKDELRTAEEAVYRTERELFHSAEQMKEVQDTHARQMQEEARIKDVMLHDLEEMRTRIQALEQAKITDTANFAEKERILSEELHAVEMAAKEEIRILDEELRNVRRWASEECYSAEEVSMLRERMLALEANVDRTEHEKALMEQELGRRIQTMDSEIRRLETEANTARQDAAFATGMVRPVSMMGPLSMSPHHPPLGHPPAGMTLPTAPSSAPAEKTE